MNKLKIKNKLIGDSLPTYFIADIAANHDSDLELAKDLIYSAAESGADAAKFQHFSANSIVSDFGFKSLGEQQSHQSTWKKSVYEVYNDASINLEWTTILKETCDKAGIHFFTSPYSFDLVDHVDPYVPAYKIGSGDVTWHDIVKYIAKKNKPYIIATGAANIEEVKKLVDECIKINDKLCIMQCNTNYTADDNNLKYINLNVIKTYKILFPNLLLGLSDHTHGHSTVLGAISLGAKMIEKHYTIDNNREGPDHKFSMNPQTWRQMVDASRELELSFGDGQKIVEANELETVVLQRRAIRASKELLAGQKLKESDFEYLRPCPKDALPPYRNTELLGKKLKVNKLFGEHLTLKDIE